MNEYRTRLLISICFFLVLTSLVFATRTAPKKSTFPIKTEQQARQTNCPDGFIKVPGNPLYKTNDFCVMKYDAKCVERSNPTIGLEPTKGSICLGDGTYKNNVTSCTCTGSREIASVASGNPITYIPETDTTPDSAKAYCEARGWHLITNPEWMTIARNVEQVPDNWCDQDGTHCGFAPGTTNKILSNGHNDNSAGALVASSDDQPCFGTTTDGSNLCGGKSSQKRTLTLSNRGVIWDLAGNVWQWVDYQVARMDQPQSYSNGKLDTGWIWSEFAPGGKATVITDNGKGEAMGYDSFRPSNPAWNSNQGVGRIYHYSALKDTDSTLYTTIRGGNWRHGYDSGAFTTHLSPMANKKNIDDVGFRCATIVR